MNLPKVDVVSPDDSVGVIARGADGFALFDSSLASKPEQTGDQSLASRSPQVWHHEPIVQAQKLRQHAEASFKHHKASPYAVEAAPHGYPKCNLFVYDVMEQAGVPMPHGKNGRRLTAHELNEALAGDPNFEKVWSRHVNESAWEKDRIDFLKNFRPEDGDIAIWDNRHLEHTGILEETLDGTGNTYYAGRDTPTGIGHFNLKLMFVQSPTKGYGPPDAIYRYKHFAR